MEARASSVSILPVRHVEGGMATSSKSCRSLIAAVSQAFNFDQPAALGRSWDSIKLLMWSDRRAAPPEQPFRHVRTSSNLWALQAMSYDSSTQADLFPGRASVDDARLDLVENDSGLSYPFSVQFGRSMKSFTGYGARDLRDGRVRKTKHASTPIPAMATELPKFALVFLAPYSLRRCAPGATSPCPWPARRSSGRGTDFFR